MTPQWSGVLKTAEAALAASCTYFLLGQCIDGYYESDVVWLHIPKGSPLYANGNSQWVPYSTADEESILSRVYAGVAGWPQTHDGGFSYRNFDGTCTSQTEAEAPIAWQVSRSLPCIFPNVSTVHDVGGGQGAYLLSFVSLRPYGVALHSIDTEVIDDTGRYPPRYVTVEPNPRLAGCIFAGVTQEMNSALHVVELERHRADLVISLGVAEHIPASSHQMFVKALASRSRKWLLFSAAVPGQGDSSASLGHISCRTPRAWRELIEMHSPFIFNAALTHAVQEAAGSVRQALGLHKARIAEYSADIYLRNGVMVFEK